VEQKKIYRTFEFGNVVTWQSEFRGILSASGHPNVEVGTRYSRELLMCGVRRTC
jgi:hypothetical protein